MESFSRSRTYPMEADKIIDAVIRALRQFDDPAFRRPLILGFAVAFLLFCVIWGGATYFVFHLPWLHSGWLDTIVSWAGEFAALLLAIFLFPTLALSTTPLFMNQAIKAVERRHYPELPPARKVGIAESTRQGIKLTILSLVVNLICLPLYFLPGVGFAGFLLLNGFLMGREYYAQISLRRIDSKASASVRASHRMAILSAGVLFAGLSLVPILNLLVPILATATFVHLFQNWTRVTPSFGLNPPAR